ncbi:MAG: 3-oxoacyl-ACP reductase FabG [Thaumarchaeota archaeon]|nr:3-oxoacyl-ACP reductase FabG [Nitrososphaerota archaeon]
MKLEGKVAIVTGGSRGIGRAISKTLAREGATVVVNYVQGLVDADNLTREITASGGIAISVRADVSKRADAQRLVDGAVARFGRLDILVNNAGILIEGTILDTREEDWDRVLGVNLKGPFNCMQAAAKVMVAQRYGKIVNVSSISGVGGAPRGEAAYASSKAGLHMLSTVASLDLGPYGINVNCLAPGYTVTDMVIKNAGSEKRFNEIREIKSQQAAMGRAGDPQDIANVALFLVSDESSFISGQVIVVDGGRKDFMSHA